MALSFPLEPSLGQTYQTGSSAEYTWNGTHWTVSNGLSGTSGTSGTAGTSGTNGAQGPQGINGTAGSSGAQGSQGPTGPQGNQGTTGPTGSGSQGAQGPTGGTGPQGNQGPNGPQGAQGVQGSTLILTSYSGSVAITGSLTVSSATIISSSLVTNTSSLYLTSGSNMYVQNNGLVEITGSLKVRGTTRLETIGGDEGGEIEFGVPQTNTTLSTSVKADVYQNRFRIFDGNTNGVYIDLSKAPTGANGEITWKASGYVNAGTFVQLDNVKVTIPTSGNRGASIGAVSTTFVANISGQFGYSGGVGGISANNVTYTTTASASAFGWNFGAEGDSATYILNDKTNSRVYRIIIMIGLSYNNNFISIERLY